MKRLIACFAVLGLCVSGVQAAQVERPAIDIVFCIDCSGSMGGVIETAKQKVWSIVNEIARAKPAPVLRIGLYGYGNGEGPFRKFDLTDDLDEVYKNLMTFKDEGWGAEFVGLAIHRATEEMDWAEGEKVLKVIYVVGNETARQGPIDYAISAPAAIAKDIVINAIYCGDHDYQTATPTWRELARLADGQYLEIKADGGAIVIASPFDDEIASMNLQLNGTYLAYGARAGAGAENQAAQDRNAAQFGTAVLAERALAKSAVQYCNTSWDLVDACKQEDFDLATIAEDELPEELRQLPADKRMEHIEAVAQKRADIQQKIQELAVKRGKFVEQQMKEQNLTVDAAFDQAVRKSIVEQAETKGFTFETN